VRILRPALPVTLLVLALLVAACGGNDEAGSSITPDPTSTLPTSTSAPVTSTEVTTTTEAPTTTTSDVHPEWEVSWAALWPPDGATATYRASLWGGGTVDLPARIDYGVDWQGGTWDRITIGDLAAGQWGLAMYFSRPEPWVLTVWGLETMGPGQGEGTFLEYSAEPGVLDLRSLPGTMARIEAGGLFDSGDGGAEPLTGTYALSVVGLETVEVAAGTLEGTLHLQLNLGGEFFGGTGPDDFTEVSDIWIQPGQLLLKWGRPAPGFQSFELLTPWA
jgi:hypothetical protein